MFVLNNPELFWNSSLKELKQGYREFETYYVCLLCGKAVEKGIIYQEDGTFYEAERFMRLHIEHSHGSVFDYLIDLDKKLTGLTDHQNSLLRLFYQGKNDREIQQELGIGSASTIRNHRFVLKEKERQAKVFLTIMELLREKDRHAPEFVPLEPSAKMVDDRYNITKEENEKWLRKYFPEGTDGPLTSFSSLQEKHKLVVLREIIKRFEPGQIYTEKEVNTILAGAYEDYAMLRRYLIEYGLLDRKPDGSQYWKKD